MKVFQIGFNKCGTSTIHFRLAALGFSAAHLKTADRRYLATVMQDNLETDDPSVIDRFLGRRLVKPLGQAPQNFTRSGLSKTLSRLVPKAVKDALPKELNRSFHYLLRKRC